MIYKVTQSKEDKKFYIAPNTLQLQNQFLIQCETKLEADNIVTELAPSPTEVDTPFTKADLFEKIGFFAEIPVFKRK